MTNFEDFAEGRNNLGQRPEFKNVEELAVDPNPIPDEMVMLSEEMDEENEESDKIAREREEKYGR